jgi:hypothetical protein
MPTLRMPAMRLPRFRLRTLMVVVAVAGIVSGAEVMQTRRLNFLKRAKDYAGREWRTRRDWEVATGSFKGKGENVLCGQMWRALVEEVPYLPSRLAYYSRMRAKYEHAARYPWLPVAPDPPPP